MLFALALHLVLSFDPAPPLSPTAVRTALEEVARIWSRYDVTVVSTLDPAAEVPPDATVLRVTPALSRRVAYDTAHGIGALDFSDAGAALPHITIDYRGLVRMTRELRRLGQKAGQWPVALRQQTIGRVLGRVLAHEVGHFLLGQRGHARSGLMRARHNISELADGLDAGYRLEDDEIVRIEAAAAAAAAAGPGGD